MKKWDHFSSFYVSFLSYGSYIVKRSAFFSSFVLLSARNLSPIMQIIYVRLKGLITTLSENIFAFVLTLTVSKILGFEVEEFYQISAESASFWIFYSLISHEL